jgi:threonine dehydratase
MTGSFKERGALNKLLLLSAEQRAAGVVAASAGNHALGVSYHGQRLGIPVTVVMPKWTPLVKVGNCRLFGAEVILAGETFDHARRVAVAMGTDRGMTYISGFDDRDIIAGQGTMGLEILEDVPNADAVIVPVGGGGLISGVGLAIKSSRPDVRVIGVEPRNAPTMYESLKAGRVTRIATSPTLADGLAVAEAGAICFQIAREVVEAIVLVDEAQIAWSVLKLLELEKTVVEGAGAATLAAARDGSLGLAEKKVVLLLCGGNIDVTVVGRVIDRGLATDGRLCRITAQLADRPGSLAGLLAAVAAAGGSVQEVSHDRNFGPADVAKAVVRCVVETRDFRHIDEIRDALTARGIDAAVE